jgi:hypothetical protein
MFMHCLHVFYDKFFFDEIRKKKKYKKKDTKITIKIHTRTPSYQKYISIAQNKYLQAMLMF